MATSSEVKSGLDDISGVIRSQRQRLADCIATAAEVSTNLSAIATNYADVKATIDAYTPTGAFETYAKDELAKLTIEFVALKADADAIAATDLND